MVGGKRKSRSQLLNEQFADDDGNFDPENFGNFADGPRAEDYDEFDGHDADDIDAGLPRKQKRGDGVAAKKTGKKSAVLRRRAPLDPMFSEGQYAAEPVSAAQINANVDSLFSMFEDGDDGGADMLMGNDFDDDIDAGAGGDDDAAELRKGGSSKKSAAKRKLSGGAKPKNQDEFEAMLDAQMAAKSQRALGSAATGDDEVLQQIEALRERQLKIADGAAASAGDDDADGEGARAETALRDLTHELVRGYGLLVQLRVKIEGGVSRAVRLPQYYARDAFIRHDPERLAPLYSAASAELWTIAEDLMRCTGPALSSSAAAKRRAGSLQALYQSIGDYHTSVMKDVDACISHWSAKMTTSYNPKHTAINRPLLEQIRGVISGKGRLLNKAQRNRLHEPIFGHPQHFKATKQERALAIADGDLDSEVFDDSDFLRELIHRSGALATKLQQSIDTLRSEQQPVAVKAKQGFHHLTKGKAINYEPRAKLVGFMVPTPFEEGSTSHETLFASLFQ